MLSTSRSYLVIDRENTLSLSSSPDHFIIEPETDTSSIGIEEIRDLKTWATLKPFESNQKVALIKQAQNLTTEAQNAMLKLLEEVPAATIIILTVDDENNLLPTIISRCARISNVEFPPELQASGLSSGQVISKPSFPSFSIPKEIGDRFTFAEELSSQGKETIMQELSNWIRNLHEKLHQGKEPNQIAQEIHEIEATRQAIFKNANARLALENLMLKIS